MASSAQNALSADSILSYMTKSLPPRLSDSPSSLLKDAYAAVALFSHACMLAVGFRLIGLGEDHKIEAQSDPETARPLPSEWDASSSYAFRYAHSQSSMEYVIKVTRLGNKALIFGLALQHDKTASFEIKAEDYISQGSLQSPASDSDTTTSLRHIFISPGRITDLVSMFNSSIIQKLAPGIHKAGYEDTTNTSSTVQENPRWQEQDHRPPRRDPLRDDFQPPARPNPYPYSDPLAAPRHPQPTGDFPPPGFDDEYDLMRPPRGMQPGGRTPFGNIGEQDLYPPGLRPNDPLRIGPGGGGGFRGGGGMHPTFDDPLFGGDGGGQGGYDPRAPPGARYDPIGPGDVPPGMRGGPRGGGRGGGGNPFSGYGSGDFI